MLVLCLAWLGFLPIAFVIVLYVEHRNEHFCDNPKRVYRTTIDFENKTTLRLMDWSLRIHPHYIKELDEQLTVYSKSECPDSVACSLARRRALSKLRDSMDCAGFSADQFLKLDLSSSAKAVLKELQTA